MAWLNEAYPALSGTHEDTYLLLGLNKAQW